jgi:putative restriction endonuclease
VASQTFRRGNKALAVTCDRGLPVRVVRGSGGDTRFSPTAGLRYDGLFYVADYWSNTGRAGLLIYQYRLHALHSTSQEGLRSPAGNFTPDRMTSVVQRLVRGTAVTRWAKNLYDCTCQVCGARLETASGP